MVFNIFVTRCFYEFAVVCLVCSGVSVFLFWAVDTEVAVVILNLLFSSLVGSGFNALVVATVESYPTHLR